jgi:hypothetical protein
VFAACAGSWWKSYRAVSLRPHVSTLVFLFPVLAVLLLANVPGWRVAYLDLASDSFHPEFDTHYEHGWPLTCLRRETCQVQTVVQPLVVQQLSPWDLPHGVIEFHGLALAGNLAAGIGILALAGVLIEARRRRRPSCFQFDLRELLALVTLVAVGLSFYAVRRKEYMEERKLYEWLQRDEKNLWGNNDDRGDWQPEGPDWLLPLLGEERYDELFTRLRAVYARGDDLQEVVKLRRLLLLRILPPSRGRTAILPPMPALEAIELEWSDDRQSVELPPLPRLRALNGRQYTGRIPVPPTYWRIDGLAGLRSLESLDVQDDQFDDASMADLEGMTHLHALDLCGKVTSAGLRHLQKSAEISVLDVSYTQIDDDAMPIIGRMETLSYLDLSRTKITDAGLESLKSLKKLEYLELYGTKVTDAGLESLKSLKGLRELRLDGTSVTEGGERSLNEALPNCRILWSPPEPPIPTTEK